jgi:hypothetical protein
MAVGLSATNFANNVLNAMCRGDALSPDVGPNANYVQLHTNAGDPGAAGTANVAGVTTRVQQNFSVAASGTINSTGTAPSWASWAGGSQTLAHISVWDATTAGNFLYSATLTTAKAITNGDTFTLSSLSVALAPIAA